MQRNSGDTILQYSQLNSFSRQDVKNLAHVIDPQVWVSYSGKEKSEKRRIDFLRTESLNKALNAGFYWGCVDGKKRLLIKSWAKNKINNAI